MKKRTLTAVCALLAFQAASLAQPPAEVASTPSVPVATETPVAAPPAYLTDEAPAANRGGQLWATGEYLFAWIQGNRMPPFVTTSPAGTPATTAGILGQPTTILALGDNFANNSSRSGYRLSAGYWLSPEKRLGVEGGFMLIESQSTFFGNNSPGSPILARPYFDAVAGSPQAVLVAFPGTSSGSIDVKVNSGNFYGANFVLTENFLDIGWLQLTSLFGYRFYRYDEGLQFRQAILPTSGTFVPGTVIASSDNFTAQNEFHGGDLGFRARFYFWDRMSLGILGKFDVGYLHNKVGISGAQTISVPGSAPINQVGGVLALSSNIGTFSRNTWAVLPELGVDLGWQMTSNIRVSLGYTLLFLNDIVRAPSQVDFNINPGLFPPSNGSAPALPAPTLAQSNIWIQSINLGLMLSF